ncbi:MAG: acylphosphatase [Chloroflexi bacterium]|nr:acylphosphatase [Chloroflexota bacterium]
MADSGEHQQLHAVVCGRVQGVSFRYYTEQRANELGLVGWVRNRGDGSVEVVAEGSPEQLRIFEEFLNHGPTSARVEGVEKEYWSATGEFTRFRIKYFGE